MDNVVLLKISLLSVWDCGHVLFIDSCWMHILCLFGNWLGGYLTYLLHNFLIILKTFENQTALYRRSMCFCGDKIYKIIVK